MHSYRPAYSNRAGLAGKPELGLPAPRSVAIHCPRAEVHTNAGGGRAPYTEQHAHAAVLDPVRDHCSVLEPISDGVRILEC